MIDFLNASANFWTIGAGSPFGPKIPMGRSMISKGGKQGNKGAGGCGVIRCFRSGNPFDHSRSKFLRGLRKLLFESVRCKGGQDR